jgi:RNA-directed DNA polymerase
MAQIRKYTADALKQTLRIHKGSYKPQAKREILIPKANGKKRPIAISAFEDKLVEWVVGKVLECMYEPTFIHNSFGFRANRSAHQAIKSIYYSLKDNKRPHVVEIDFANCFGSISHRKLMEVLSKRIRDSRIKGLIGRFLKVGILDQAGSMNQSEAGTPQGSVMSPVLANIFLHEVLDQWFMTNYASSSNVIVRYADDAVFLFRSKDMTDRFVKDLEDRTAHFGLKLNEEKTGVIHFGRNENTSFDFLGFTIYWGQIPKRGARPLKVKTQQKKLHKKIQEFYDWIKEVRSRLKLEEIWELARAKLVGHYNYYGFSDNVAKLNHFYHEAIRSLFRWLNRRSQKCSYDWEQFKRRLEFHPLPAPPPMNKLIHLGRKWSYQYV